MARQPAHTRASPATSLGRAFSLLLFLLAAFLLCVRPATSLYTPLLRHDKSLLERAEEKLVSRADPWADYGPLIDKGRLLHCAMAADQQTANDLLGDDKAVRRWTDYGDLVRYGWLEEEGRSPDASMAQDSLGTAGVFQELSIDVGQNEKVRVDHSETVVIDGNEYKETAGFYQSLFNVDSGLIVGGENCSPRMAEKGWPAEDYVPLKQWSDVVFLLWQHVAGSNARSLQHHIQCLISNDDTRTIMRKAIREDDGFSDWDDLSPLQEGGRTFRPNSQEYYALLGSPNGFGIAWLLIQHKAQLGVKTVSEITVFGADSESSLYFKIDSVQSSYGDL